MKHILIVLSMILLSSCRAGIIEEKEIESTTIEPETIKVKIMNTDQIEKNIITEKIDENCLVFDDFSDSSKNNWLIVND